MSLVTEALRKARIAVGLSQQDVARALGISQPFVNDIEHGRRALAEHHFDKLPQPIRIAVVRAAIVELQERISKHRQVLTFILRDG